MPQTIDIHQLLAQLGGNRFLVMTGARNLVRGPNYLQMDLPGTLTKGRGNRLTITLNDGDLYDLTFARRRGLKFTTLASEADVYASEIQRAFTRLTGLYTHL